MDSVQHTVSEPKVKRSCMTLTLEAVRLNDGEMAMLQNACLMEGNLFGERQIARMEFTSWEKLT